MEYLRAQSAPDVCRALATAEKAHVIAGGTDLIVQMKSRRLQPGLVVDIKHLPGIADINEADGAFTIGAAVTGAMIGEADALVRAWPGVCEAAQLIGSSQVQGRATVVGNLCNASPAADTVPALIAADAVAIVEGPDASREVRVADIPSGPGVTTLARGEFVTAVRLPARPVRAADAYLRFIPRTEMDIAAASAGVDLVLDAEGTVTGARVALGAVAAVPYLAREAGDSLVGTRLEDAALERLARLCSESCDPIDDKRGTVAFRRHVVGVLARRAARIAYDRAMERN